MVGAKQVARLIGVDHLVTLDMGGTSTDISNVVDGCESFTTSFEIEFGLPIQIPMIDIRTLGSGGGSLAWIDKGGMLRVGPESAGAAPGPACYGLGGSRATATDANVVLGRINPTNFLGGEMTPRYRGRRDRDRRGGQGDGLVGARDGARHGANIEQQYDRWPALGADRTWPRSA